MSYPARKVNEKKKVVKLNAKKKKERKIINSNASSAFSQ